MTKHGLLKTTVRLDGKRIAVPGDVTFDVDTEETEISSVESVNPVSYYGRTIGSGSIKFRAPVDPYANDPIEILDALGFREGYYAFNPSGETIDWQVGPYDMWDEPVVGYGVPVVPMEKRQLEETSRIAISYSGSYRRTAFRFKAGGDSLRLLRFLASKAVGANTSTVTLEVWSDNAGAPNAIVASTNSLTVHFSTGDDSGTDVYTDAALAESAVYTGATWQSVSFQTVDILDGELLTVGDYYWIVFISINGQDPIYFNVTSNDNFEDHTLQFYTGAVWEAATGGTNLCFVLQEEMSVGGHSLILESWNSDGTEGVQWIFGSCKVRIAPPTIGPKKDIEVSLTFRSYNVQGPTGL